MKFSLKQLTQQGSSEGLCVVAVMAATFTRRPLRRARDGFSNPSITQHAVDIRVTPSPPSDAGLSSPLASRQESADLHFQIIAHLAEGTTGVADPEVVDPTGHDCVDAGNNYRHGGGLDSGAKCNSAMQT